MTCLTLGCGLTGAGTVGGEAGPPNPIAATVVPAMVPLYDGQTVGDVPSYATMVSTGNFTSSGTIVSAVVTFTGDATAADDPLVEGETAGFTVTVTDDQSNQRIFDAGLATVEYKVRVNGTAGNEADIDINPRVPDGETLSITITGGAHAGTYTPTAGDLRNNACNLAKPGITGNTDLGDTLTRDRGLWTTPTGSLTFADQWLSDAGDIGGATGATFDITASEQGTDVTVEVEGDDGTHTPVVAESDPVSIPAGAASSLVTFTTASETDLDAYAPDDGEAFALVWGSLGTRPVVQSGHLRPKDSSNRQIWAQTGRTPTSGAITVKAKLGRTSTGNTPVGVALGKDGHGWVIVQHVGPNNRWQIHYYADGIGSDDTGATLVDGAFTNAVETVRYIELACDGTDIDVNLYDHTGAFDARIATVSKATYGLTDLVPGIILRGNQGVGNGTVIDEYEVS